jgi:hypothetical protein
MAQPTLLDQYEYGMCGKVFRYDYLADRQVCVTTGSPPAAAVARAPP